MGLSRFNVRGRNKRADTRPAPIVAVETTVMPDRGSASRFVDGTTRQGEYPSFLGWDNNHQVQLANGVSKFARRKDQYPLGPLNASVPNTPTITNPDNPQPSSTWNTTGNAPKGQSMNLIAQSVKSSGNTAGAGPGSVIFTGSSAEGSM